MKNKNLKTAFTLIELLVTIVIIGILATISVATYGGYQERAKTAKEKAECAQVDICNKTKAICIEAGDTEEECDKLCDATSMITSCPRIYPPESEWTDASCFAFSSGEITGYYRNNSDCLDSSDMITPLVIEGENITSIGGWAFRAYGQSTGGATSVTIPNSVTNIGTSAFEDNSLTSVIIPGSVVSIGNYAFRDNQINSITIEEGVTTIPRGMFSYNHLTSITIPASTISMGSYAFYNNGPDGNSGNISGFVSGTEQTWNLVGTTWVKQ